MATSEFAHGLMQDILKSIYDGIYPLCETCFNGMFKILNNRINASYDDLKVPVDEWNPDVFTFIQNTVVKDIIIPIAASFITFIFCMELIHLMQEENQMHSIKPQNVLFIFIKFAVCALICSKSFNIIMGFQDIGALAIKKLGDLGVGALNLDGSLQLNDLLPETPTEYTVTLVLTLLGDMLLLAFSCLISLIMSVMVMMSVTMWYIEFLIYASAAPIPFATFDNKEWAQVGLNYTRKMLALSFRGFFMLLMVVIYAYMIASMKASDDFLDTLTKLIGSGVVLISLLYKAGNISSSIFNTH